MKTRFPLSALVVIGSFVAPLMASPIPIGAPANPGYAMGSNIGLGFAELDVLSTSYKRVPDSFNLQGSADNLRGTNLQESLDNPRGSNLQESLDDPIPAAETVGTIARDGGENPDPTALRRPVSEPSGLLVMLGSALFGAGALLRRRLKT